MSTIKVTNLKHESSSSDNISLDSSGRVGVGTASPGTFNAKLAIYGTDQDSSRIALIRSGNAGTSISVDGGLVFGADGSTGGTARMKVTNTGNVQFDSGYGSVATAYGCRAWVNFDGTSGSIGSGRANGNISSITDNATGDYTLSFSTALVDADYSVVASCGTNVDGSIPGIVSLFRVNTTGVHVPPTTSAFRITTSAVNGGNQDGEWVCVAVFR